ncbi:hypothetical protein Pfo_028588 [Paulownia fortunei]|nr:hypothetical protein Pfo_028588 [Paulownia fortunei]
MERFFPLFCFSLLALLSTCSSPVHGAWALKTDSLTRELLESARDAEFLDWLRRVRRKIHEYPELAFEEQLTSQLIRSELDSLGSSMSGRWLKQGGGHYWVGAQPWFGLRADMDALPIQGTVKLVFQPGEEGYAGAYYMVKDGAVDGVEAIFGLHVEPTMPTGTISSKPGPMLAGSARFSVIIQGKGGHAASPHKTRDPILALSMVILALQHIVSRETDPLEPRVYCQFGGTFRFMNSESYSYLKQRIKEYVIETQAAVHQCTAVVDFMEGKLRPYPATINHPMMYEHAKRIGENLLGEHGVRLHSMTMGAEDFSFYSEKMPAAFFMIGARNETMTSVKGWHSPHFVIDEGVLPIGASLHAAVALSYLDGHAEKSVGA